jgi:redox-sensitive bicupin YhaK (pirin superfamily)
MRFLAPPPPADGPVLDLLPGRLAHLTPGDGGVRRLLPTRGRRLVGGWCFADHFGPSRASGERGGIGPHPHIGLQTVTWLISGRTRHRDSLGTEQPIVSGEVNWMTAGHGICHAEDGEAAAGEEVHGVQLWVALPEAARHRPPMFEHVLPPVGGVDGATATVIAGAFAGLTCAATTFSPLVGVDAQLPGGRGHDLPLDATFEHAVMVIEGAVRVEGVEVAPGALLYLGRRRDHVRVGAAGPARVLLLGGAPLGEPVKMWWNFVFREAAEAAEAARAWSAREARFGTVTGSPSPWIPAPAFPG